jgi:DNA-binding GntR family transcriptional regulator
MGRPQEYDHVVQEITDRVKIGRYRQGDRLTLKNLTQEFGISQGTAVTAMQILAAQGIVHQKPGTDGYRISPPPEEDDDNATITTCPSCHAMIAITLRPA